jgi:amino acid adenylation domain-containing protein
LAAPDAVAVVAERTELTYRQLEQRANAIARDLQARGVGPEVVVALLGNRSAEMVLGALAILKAGGAYLPLDASYPAERLAYIVEDAGCSHLLFTPDVAGLVPAALRDRAVGVVVDGPQSDDPPAVDTASEGLAYVIYTSGSTGRPKGVEITHAALLNLVMWHERTFRLEPTDRATQVASVGFDAAVWEVWPYLAAGATLYIPDEAVRNDPEALRDWLVDRAITISFVPTPMAARLMMLPWPTEAPLRTMLTGGDVLHAYPPPGLPFRLVNNYGPTECAVVATSGPVDPYEQPDARPAIGRPIDNVTIHLLDEEMRSVPAGSAGEIYIGGAGVARGYRNQPALTAAKFLPDPNADEDRRARLYRTGDLGRRLPDGQIAFIGRADDQLKVRGFRIEPNEIVTALDQQPGVVASAVVGMDAGGGEKRLVAYVVLAVGSQPTPATLQAALREKLPDYMIPAVFVRIGALPQGPHGKVDRTALPEPAPANTLRDSPYQAPRTPVEKRIAELVRELWRIEEVSIHDNLFLLGGHSLIATQLIGRIRLCFDVQLGLRKIFEGPTISALAQEVERLLVEKVSAITEDEARRLLAGAHDPTARQAS